MYSIIIVHDPNITWNVEKNNKEKLNSLLHHHDLENPEEDRGETWLKSHLLLNFHSGFKLIWPVDVSVDQTTTSPGTRICPASIQNLSAHEKQQITGKIFRRVGKLDADGLIQGTRVQWPIWWVWKLWESYATALYVHHISTQWKKYEWLVGLDTDTKHLKEE